MKELHLFIGFTLICLMSRLGIWSVEMNSPPIETSWEVCAEYLVPFMREKGWDYEIKREDYGGFSSHFEWTYGPDSSKHDINAKIINDNLALAACEAFLQIPNKEVGNE